MALRDILEKFSKRDSKFKEMRKEDTARSNIQTLKKSANERELEKRLEEKRQEKITVELKKLKDKEKGSLLQKDTFDKSNMFREDQKKQILKQEVIFKHGNDMFFK